MLGVLPKETWRMFKAKLENARRNLKTAWQQHEPPEDEMCMENSQRLAADFLGMPEDNPVSNPEKDL